MIKYYVPCDKGVKVVIDAGFGEYGEPENAVKASQYPELYDLEPYEITMVNGVCRKATKEEIRLRNFEVNK